MSEPMLTGDTSLQILLTIFSCQCIASHDKNDASHTLLNANPVRRLATKLKNPKRGAEGARLLENVGGTHRKPLILSRDDRTKI